MKALLVGTSFLPSYGGPAFSVSRLAHALADAGVIIGVWAPDGSALTSPLLPQLAVQRFNGNASDALTSFGRPDILHDNGIWLPHNHQLARLAVHYRIPRVVSLRGMIEPWAMGHKRWKKGLAWHLYQRRDLQRAQCHHATAEVEATNLRQYKLGVPICVVPNGMDIPAAHPSAPDALKERSTRNSRKIALFLSRIHPKKGLPMLVAAWAAVRPPGWVLRIAGPDEAGHLAEINALVKNAGISDVVSFLGPIDTRKKQALYGAADLFVLPTHSENFGMVVAEALAHGVPVLTTKGAPWPMLPGHRCGWWVDATVDGIAEGLRQAASCDKNELRSMGARGRILIREQFGWQRICNQFISIYERILGK